MADVLTAEHVLEFPYSRSVGPILGKFFTGLRDREIWGIKSADGRVLVPPQEYDPETSASLSEWVRVGQSGEVTTWSWNAHPRAGQPLDEAFAWALIRLDGADVPMLHAVRVEAADEMATGMRVTVQWADQTVGHINDIACFVPEASS